MKDVTVTRWDKDRPPTKDDLRKRFAVEHLDPYTWSNAPGDVYTAHAHSYHKVIMVVEGSIMFGLPERGEQVELHAGDRLDLPRGIRHDAKVGPSGVTCLEAHQH